MKKFIVFFLFLVQFNLIGQTPTDYLPTSFHKERRAILRSKMPKNSVAVIFANPIRNRSNDVDYIFHQSPNFYYLTGLRESNSVLVMYAENQTDKDGMVFNEVLYLPKKDAKYELWHGEQLGVDGAKNKLGFKVAKASEDFEYENFNFNTFDVVFTERFQNDYRNSRNTSGEIYDLVQYFKYQAKEAKVDIGFLSTEFARMRQIKTPEELKLLKKAIRISAIGHIEVMKALQPNMSEREVQGIHELVYKKYKAEDNGYPPIIGAGNNGCVLHYNSNDKTIIKENELVLMDVGAQYRGYSADITRTIPTNGKFSPEQKAIYNLVLKAQVAGVEACKVGNAFWKPGQVTREIINKGLAELGITKSANAKHNYFPHGTSHHIGLDVHDPSMFGALQENMVITVEPGIYIPEGSPCDKKWWGIAVRIEDDILITQKEPVNLSSEVPKTVEAIEEMMAKQSPLNSWKLPDLD